MKKFIVCLIAVISVFVTANAQYITSYTSRSGQEYLINNKDLTPETMSFYATLVHNYEATLSNIERDKGIFWGGFIAAMVGAGVAGISAYQDNYQEIFIAGCIISGIGDIVMSIGGIKWILDIGKAGNQEVQLSACGIVIPF